MRLIDADALLDNINERIENLTSVDVAVDCAYLWALIYDEIKEAPTIEPSGDLISREDVIDVIHQASTQKKNNYHGFTEKGLIEYINALPSADRPTEYNLETIADIVRQLGHLDSYIADRPKGEWKTNQTYKTLVYCSECGMAFKDSLLPRNYCPCCGAEMK